MRTKPNFPLFYPYICVKIVYLIVILLNFLLLSFYFEFNYFTYGYKSLYMQFVKTKSTINDDMFFPKLGWCSVAFFSKKFPNIYTVQCSLPVNLFNKYFYLGFWFWMFILAVLNVLSIFYWLLLTNRTFRKRLVYNGLQLDEEKNLNISYTSAYYFTSDTSKDLIDNFLIEKTGLSLDENFSLFFYHVCSCDVIFAIKLIALNSNNLALRDILNNLWDHYLDLEDSKSREIKQRPILNVKRPANTKFLNVNEKRL